MKQEQRKRRRGPPPSGIDKSTFIKALDELSYQLGTNNVEVNEKPLVDGWYMERKYYHVFQNWRLAR
jgi:hypothetical protein